MFLFVKLELIRNKHTVRTKSHKYAIDIVDDFHFHRVFPDINVHQAKILQHNLVNHTEIVYFQTSVF